MAKKPADFRNFLHGKKQEEATPSRAQRWWTLKGDAAAAGSGAAVVELHRIQKARLDQMLFNARLYGSIAQLGPLGMLNRIGLTRATMPSKASFNAIESGIDTVVSKMAKNKPEPLFLTSGGNFHQQRRAQRLTDYATGVLYENRFHELRLQTLRDALVWGSGVVGVLEKAGRVCIERVMPAELYVDEMEAFYREPRQMYRVKSVDRLVAAEAFPDFKAKLLALTPEDMGDTSLSGGTSDLLQIVEAWHLPSGPDAKDGRHVISCGPLHLNPDADEWDKPHFPFAKLDWSPRQYGYWAKGAAEQVAGIQLEINQLSWVAQRSFFMGGSYKVMLKMGSKVNTATLNDQVGAIIEYAGDTPPQYVVPPLISPEHLNRIEMLKNAVFAQLGVSQMSASSQKPAGLNSGRALREANDIEADRFTTCAQAVEQFTLDVTRLVVSTAGDIAKGDGEANLSVRKPGKRSLKKLDWEECAMDEADYVTRIFPVSALPNEPAGRIATVTEMVQGGIISPERGRRLLDFPDLEAEEQLENAQQDYLVKVLDDIVDEGLYAPPEPQDNLDEARKLALQYYAHGKTQGLEDERLQMIRDFLEQLDGLAAAAMPPGAPGSAATGVGTPQAAPMAPPQSDLIPNVPGAA